MHCDFCDVSQEKGFSIVYEDDKFVAFKDISPAARLHVQVVPKRHIASVRSLNKDDIPILQSMQKIGDKIFDDYNVSPSMRKMGFHIPPITSVNHLHLHVQAKPYISPLRAWSYPIRRGWGPFHKGFSWFVEVKQAVQILETGNQIGILPC